MKKLINNLQILAMMALIPAMVIAYLGTTETGKTEQTEKKEMVRKGNNLVEIGNMIQLVKSF